MTKKCPRCNLVIDEKEFNWKIKGKLLAAYCKLCSRKYIQEHYKAHTQYYIAKAKKRNALIKQRMFKYVSSFLQTHPCVDCGETDILVLQFDHKDRASKSYDVSHILRRMLAHETLVKEIQKCEVRCANCHRRKTEKESNSWKLHIAPVV